MAIYTSYFGNYRNFPKEAIVIGVTRKPLKGVKNWLILAPSEKIFSEFKTGKITEHAYKNQYLKYLNSLNKEEIINILKEAEQKYNNVILCCYEKKQDFCHRHILAEWLDINIKEL